MCQVPWIIQKRREQAVLVILVLIVVLVLVVPVGLWTESRFSTSWNSDWWVPDCISIQSSTESSKIIVIK